MEVRIASLAVYLIVADCHYFFRYDGVAGTYVDLTHAINAMSAHVAAEQYVCR